MPFLTLKSLKSIVLQIVYRYFAQDIYVISVLLKQNNEKKIVKHSEIQNLSLDSVLI